ncbi:MAG: STM4013/SEN3800 family hydrolase [Myxococcota bacterium]
MTAAPPALDARSRVGTHDVVLVTLDTLRLDVAQRALAEGRLPVLGAHLGPAGWEARHTPGSFTYAAHAAFFAGFLPTPTAPGPHPRLLAVAFPGATTIGPGTAELEGADIVSGFAARGYRTVCIGGTGFFNLATPLGRALPSLFQVARWEPGFGVTARDSTERQVAAAVDELGAAGEQRVFLFLNVSALHQPNRHYLPGAAQDSAASMLEALAYVDGALAPLFAAVAARGPSLWVVCADHGTAYGEEGHTGHRVGLPVVYTVPYAEFALEAA